MPLDEEQKRKAVEEEYELLKRRMSQLGLLALEMTWREWYAFILKTYPEGPLPPKLPMWDKSRLKEMYHLINHKDSQYKGELER